MVSQLQAVRSGENTVSRKEALPHTGSFSYQSVSLTVEWNN